MSKKFLANIVNKFVLVLSIAASLLVPFGTAAASTSNLSVFSDKPIPEIGEYINKRIIEMHNCYRNITEQEEKIKINLDRQRVLEKKIDTKQKEFAEYLTVLYKDNTGFNLILNVLDSKTLFDALNNLELLKYTAAKTSEQVDSIKRDNEALKKEQKQLEEIRNSYQENITRIQSELKFLEQKGIIPKGAALGVPEEIKYRDISPYYDLLINWLNQKQSMQADKSLLEIVNAAGSRWNIDPLLLIAITGQEQSFVPAGDSAAYKIINNPWNVFHSWQEFQGGYSVSALWAANTVARLSRDCPPGTNIIKWVNGYGSDNTRSNPRYGYAEDPNWWVGVSHYYEGLKQLCSAAAVSGTSEGQAVPW